MIPQRYTCEGENVCPTLMITDPPIDTQSFAIIVHDHDAQSGDFAHWLIWNIDPAVHEILKETTPIGATEGMNDFGAVGWGGPCPPSGKHRYEFHLYALDTTLELETTSKKEDLRNAIRGHTLEEASIVGLYEKSS